MSDVGEVAFGHRVKRILNLDDVMMSRTGVLLIRSSFFVNKYAIGTYKMPPQHSAQKLMDLFKLK